ncbi:amino acid permease [Rhodococcus triatomae BKS 15-14]|nr:amino acid permease [Rhodococcus triatomae BKS 15-14]
MHYIAPVIENVTGANEASPAGGTTAPPAKGLAKDALTLTSSVVIGVASAGPAYSIAATLGLVVAAVGLQAPAIALLAFVPILFAAFGYQQLNRADPDCGTTFVWATRAFGPTWGWMSGWAIVVADVLVMASMAQVAGQYIFLFFGADGIGDDPTHVAVLALGVAFMLVMTWLCFRGIELSARVQSVLLTVEFVALVVFAIVALVRVWLGAAGEAALSPQWSWFNPFEIGSFSTFVNAMLLMVFIYWGWDSVVSVNEETVDERRTPGRSAIISTIVLVSLYVLVTVAAQSFAGVSEEGSGLANPEHFDDFFAALGTAVFGEGALGQVLVHVLLLMILTSAIASTQTTILPTARTTLSMGVFRALPAAFASVHPRFRTPTVSTLAMGGVSALIYIVFNFIAAGDLIYDSVAAIGIAVGFYYGMTGVACTWLYRRTLRENARTWWLRGALPLTGGLMLLFAAGWTAVTSFDPEYGETYWTLPFAPHWQVGGVFILGVGSMLLGYPLMWWCRRREPAFFDGEVVERRLPDPVTVCEP